MVSVGTLVREVCSIPEKGRLGTVVKVTNLVMSDKSNWQVDLDRWNASSFASNGLHCAIIRPGSVFSVRWQNDATQLSVHVLYNDTRESSIDYNAGTVEVVS